LSESTSAALRNSAAAGNGGKRIKACEGFVRGKLKERSNVLPLFLGVFVLVPVLFLFLFMFSSLFLLILL
jgi:hypothetical protein